MPKQLYVYDFTTRAISNIAESPNNVNSNVLTQNYIKSHENTYADKYNYIHCGTDELMRCYFEVLDDDWYEMVGLLGQWLDEEDYMKGS